jgi:PKD repeat protein
VAFAEANWTSIDQGVIFSDGGCNVYIPDANFKAALLADAAINTNNDSEIQYGEAEAYTGSIEVENLAIADMTGLEAFKSITGLNCADNELTQLVLRYHTALESVDCSGNQLDALDMKANEALKSLKCVSNQLTSLDVRNGHNTQITEFDATNNPNLTCISVDDAAYSKEQWSNIDVHTSFNNDCGFAASFEADVLSGPLPLAVQFTDRSTDNSDAWLWDFGDGNSSDQQSPSHTYTTVGKYTVSLTISDGITSDTEVKSELIEVLKGNQTITFEALDSKTFGDADFDLSATASSGLDVSYTSSDLTVATIDGNTVIIVGAGTTTITASQAGDDNYLAATDVQQTLTVEKAAQTITFGDLDSKTVEDADFDLSATASSGLDVSYTSSDLTVATIDGNTVIIVGAGTTTITASQAGDDNYLAATDVQQTLTVEKAAQTITFGDLDSKTVEDADFDLSATASSGLDVSYTSSDLTVATIDGNTVTIVGAGTTTITASQAGDDNYNAATDVQQSLTVEKAGQTITFGALDNKTFGDADFDLTATASSGLDVSYTSSDLTVATIDGSTVSIVGAGTTTITASQAGDDNYNAATDVQQSLTVEKAGQTITFGALDNKTFGDADFDLTATASSGLDVSYTSSDLTVATIDGSTVSIVGAGTTTITASQAGDDNYLAATDVQQTLTVEKAAQTITFGDLDSKTVEDADFDLSATASSGLDVSYTSSDLTVATIDGNTVIIVGAGTTTIIASQAGDDNYLAATDVQQTLTVEKAAQTITFGDLDSKTVEDADFDLSATASSGLDVSYTSSDLTVATIDGNTVTIVGAGTTTITASQAGDDNYNAATDVQQSLTVEKAGQTITFGALDNKTFGDADFDLRATASSGLDVSYTSSDLTVATIDGNTVIIVGAGTTTITASQAGDDNYLAATDVQQTLTVEKAAQTITFGDLDSKTVEDADFDLSATASSGLDVSYTSSDLTVATIDGNTVIIVGAGTTTITASQAGDDNYLAATDVQQTLTVEKAAQTITFGALDNKTFGDADFDLRATASSGLDVSYTSSDLTVATIDGSTVNIIGAGTTTITASQTGDDNYNAATDVQQSLTVEKAGQTITFGALDNKTFGDADFDLTATASSGLDVSYTSSDLTVATIDGSTVSIVGAGTTTITASQAGDDNYLAATEVQQTLTVEKAAQSITFGALDNKTFGDADFGLTATASSGLDVSYSSSDLTVATIDGSTVTIVGAGTTTITASQAGDDNYHAADPVAQTLEVMEITALTVEEEDRILVYPNPASSTMILQFESGMRSIRMLNLNGQTVCEKHGIDKLAGRLEIDTSPYPPGEYIIRFEGEGKTTARKVLISR